MTFPLPASGAGRSLNPPPCSASAIAFRSRISTGNFPLHLQDRNVLPGRGSLTTTSRSSLLPDSVPEPQRVQTVPVPASSWFALFQRAERSWKVSHLREFFFLQMLHSVSGTSAGRSPPTKRGQGQPRGEQPGVWDLRLLRRGRKEEEQRDLPALPSHGTYGREHLGRYWHLGTSGALWLAEELLRSHGTAPDTSLLGERETPEMRDSWS